MAAQVMDIAGHLCSDMSDNIDPAMNPSQRQQHGDAGSLPGNIVGIVVTRADMLLTFLINCYICRYLKVPNNIWRSITPMQQNDNWRYKYHQTIIKTPHQHQQLPFLWMDCVWCCPVSCCLGIRKRLLLKTKFHKQTKCSPPKHENLCFFTNFGWLFLGCLNEPYP